MDTAISKELVAVVMMTGVIIWVEKERADRLSGLENRPRNEWPQFIDIDGEKVNPSRVEGIFSAQAMESMQRRKNGEWQCKWGHWHDRGDKCEHVDPTRFKKRCEEALAYFKREGYLPLNSPSMGDIITVLGKDALK